MRFVVRLLLVPVIVLSLGLLSLSVFNVAAAGAMYAYDGATFSNTCEMTRAFGARTPFCALGTGFPAFDSEVNRILQALDPFRVWGAAGAASATLLWVCFTLLSLVAPRADPFARRAPRRVLATVEDDGRVGFAPGTY